MLNNVSSLIISHIPTQNGKLCVFIRPPSFPVLPPRGTPSATPSQRNRLIHLTLPRAIRYLLPRETIPFALQNHTYCLAKPYVLPPAPSARPCFPPRKRARTSFPNIALRIPRQHPPSLKRAVAGERKRRHRAPPFIIMVIGGAFSALQKQRGSTARERKISHLFVGLRNHKTKGMTPQAKGLSHRFVGLWSHKVQGMML